MGGGITAMHYTARAAMRLPAMCRYSSVLVILSVLLAVVLSLVSLWLTSFHRDAAASRRWRKAASVLSLGAANPVMHYVGMAAAGAL